MRNTLFSYNLICGQLKAVIFVKKIYLIKLMTYSQ